MGKAARRFLLAFTLLAMAAVTAFVCVFLLFKVRTIEVTGDQVYDPLPFWSSAATRKGITWPCSPQANRRRH